MDAYLGSEMHFYRSCMANLVKANGFEVFRLDRTPTIGRATDSLIKVKLLYYNARNGIGDSLSYWRKQAMMPAFDQRIVKPALKPTDYLKTTNERGIFALTYPQRLYVSYKNPEKGAVTFGSILTFIKPEVFFDSNGIVIDPLSIQVDAYWAKLRMADTLPYNYEPNIVVEEI